jgi:hypothetical protein
VLGAAIKGQHNDRVREVDHVTGYRTVTQRELKGKEWGETRKTVDNMGKHVRLPVLWANI